MAKLAEKRETRILALDPGSVNFGWSLVKIHRKRANVIRCGMLTHLAKELDETLRKNLRGYLKQSLWLLDKANPTDLVAERYLPRIRGLTVENVNMMIGVVLTIIEVMIPKTRTKLYLPATWKNHVNKVLKLEELYVLCKPVPDHAVDATLMGLYYAEKNLGFSLAHLRTKKEQRKLAKQIKDAYIDLKGRKR